VAPPVPIPNTEVKRCSPDDSTSIGCAKVGRRQSYAPFLAKAGNGALVFIRVAPVDECWPWSRCGNDAAKKKTRLVRLSVQGSWQLAKAAELLLISQNDWALPVLAVSFIHAAIHGEARLHSGLFSGVVLDSLCEVRTRSMCLRDRYGRSGCRSQKDSHTVGDMPGKRRSSSGRKTIRSLDPDDPHFIQGIHHYCDRWCERCLFSHRCFKFAYTEQVLGTVALGPKRRATQTVFDALSRVLSEARHELELAAKKLSAGGEDQKVAANIAVEKRIQRRAMRAGARETKAAHTYARMVDEWFNNELQLPLRYIRSLESRVREGILSVTDAKGDLVRLNDSVEVIRWHQHLIYVKLCRAFSSQVEEEGTKGRPPRDSDGSAKVALLSVDHSIEAWSQLAGMFPVKSDSVLEILVHLDRLRRSIVAKFPRARHFPRPGFDRQRAKKGADLPE
jgi:hypothetical protein